jgi:integrase
MLPPKTKKSTRAIDIDEGLARILREHIGDRTSGLVFQSKTGTPLRGGNIIKRVLNSILDKLGIPRGGKVNHAFRHGRVTVLRKNAILGDLQKPWIGHSSLDMTGPVLSHLPGTRVPARARWGALD